MPAGEGVDLPAILRVVLDAVIAHYAAATGITLPERRIIPPGEARGIAWDCEQCAVTSAGLTWSPSSGQASSATTKPTGNPVSVMQVRYADVAVQIVRKVPEPDDGRNPPPAREMTEAGLRLARDAALLSQALVEVCGPRGALREYGNAQPGDVIAIGPLGFYAAVEGTLSVTAGRLS